MARTWEQMTVEEKLDDLRRDLKATMQTVNQIKRYVGGVADDGTQLSEKVDEIQKRLPPKKASKA